MEGKFVIDEISGTHSDTSAHDSKPQPMTDLGLDGRIGYDLIASKNLVSGVKIVVFLRWDADRQ